MREPNLAFRQDGRNRSIPRGTKFIRSFGAMIGFTALLLGNVGLGQSYNAATDLIRLPWDQLVDRSELIVVARALDVVSPDEDSPFFQAHKIDVLATIKGDAFGDITVITRPVIVEAEMRCCEVGGYYIFFLKHGPNGFWNGVNGRYSVIQIEEE